MSSLKVQFYRHPRSGKPLISEAKLPLSFKGENVEILLEAQGVSVFVDGTFTGRVFERSVTFSQLLYHVTAWVDAQGEN